MKSPISPIINALNQPFWTAAEAGVLVLPFCTHTDRAFWPPSPTSPYQPRSEVAWRRVEPRGVLKAIAVYQRSFLKSFEPFLPYGIGLVEVAPAVRLQAFVRDPLVPNAPQADDVVRLMFERLLPEHVLVLSVRKGGDGDGQ